MDDTAQVQLFERLHRLAHRCQCRHPDVFNEHRLGCGGSALHAVHNHHVGPGNGCQLHIVEGAGGTHLHINRLFPIGDLAQFPDLDHQVIRPGPVWMAAGRALVHPFGQVPHARHPRVDLLPEQHATPPRLGALPDDDLDRVGAAQVIRVKAIT